MKSRKNGILIVCGACLDAHVYDACGVGIHKAAEIFVSVLYITRAHIYAFVANMPEQIAISMDMFKWL